jgi:hypothetical protein
MSTKQENFREVYPAHIGYSAEDIQQTASHKDTMLTEPELATVCRAFNRADHSYCSEMLADIVAEVIAERDGRA